jgi:hypothetical protein
MHLMPTLAALSWTLIPAVAMAEACPIASAPVSAETQENVHVQPHGYPFDPNSAGVDDVQRRLTIFNAEQAVQDAAFDRKLKSTICRGC